MDFYNLPKDILVKLLLEKYDSKFVHLENLNIPMCDELIERLHQKKQQIQQIKTGKIKEKLLKLDSKLDLKIIQSINLIESFCQNSMRINFNPLGYGYWCDFTNGRLYLPGALENSESHVYFVEQLKQLNLFIEMYKYLIDDKSVFD